MSGVRFYCGVNEKRWNRHPVDPGQFACIAPIYGASKRTRRKNSVQIPAHVAVIQDSGAFSDSWDSRLAFPAALERQIAHAEFYKYSNQITHRASYDLLIDEVWHEGNRTKRRWSVQDAESAVDATVAAARYMDNHRDLGLVQSAQGVDAKQYLQCVERILPYINPAKDILGFGGWCITGKMPKQMLPVFRDTILKVIPFVAQKGIKRIHIWGVIYPYALGEMLWMCDQHGIELSTDSAGPARQPAFGQWGYGNWRDNQYKRVSVETRGLERARHVKLTSEWLSTLHLTDFYRPPMQSTHKKRGQLNIQQYHLPLGV